MRSLSLALLAVVVAVAAPVPKKPKVDYQKLADETEWKFPEGKAITEMLADEFKGYRAEVLSFDDGAKMTVLIANAKKEALLKLETHVEVSLAQREGVVYYPVHSPIGSGCKVVAFDLTAKKELWSTGLKGMGLVLHSWYRNQVRLEVLDGDTLRVWGKESAGRYVEIVDRTTGKTVGHKVFKEKE